MREGLRALICGGAKGVLDAANDAPDDAPKWKLNWDEENVPESWVRKGQFRILPLYLSLISPL